MRLRLFDMWKNFSEEIRHKHRLVVMDSDTYKEKFSLQLTGVNFLVAVGVSAVVLVLITSLLIAFTPIHNLIPGYVNHEMTEQTFRNAQTIDSLEYLVEMQERQLREIKDLVEGKTVSTPVDSQQKMEKGVTYQYRRSRADTLLRRQVERRRMKN